MSRDVNYRDLLDIFLNVLSEMPIEVVGKPKIDGDSLSFLDNRMRLQLRLMPNEPGTHPTIFHVHAVTELQLKFGPVPLEACVIGLGSNLHEGVREAAIAWKDCVAPPIFSLLHAKSVLDAMAFDGSETWAVPNRCGFAGPFNLRALTMPEQMPHSSYESEPLRNAPLFTTVDELVFDTVPRLVKITLNRDGKGTWKRSIDFDNHELGFSENDWKPPVFMPNQPIIATRFMVFFLPCDPEVEPKRAQIKTLDEAIRLFVAFFEGVAPQEFDLQKGVEYLISLGFDADKADRLAQFIVLALGRTFTKQLGAKHSPTYAYVHANGHYETGLHIESDPMFFRTAVLAKEFLQSDRFKSIIVRLAIGERDFQMLNDLLHRKGNPKNMMLSPPLIFARNIDANIAHKAAVEITNAFIEESKKYVKRKKWWQFWK